MSSDSSRAKQIKKIKRRPVIAGFDKDDVPIMGYSTEFEIYSSFDAAKYLAEIFGLKQVRDLNKEKISDFNANVERVMQAGIDSGVTLRGDDLRKEVEKRLNPLYPILGHPSNNTN